jgi:hypothetical protein
VNIRTCQKWSEEQRIMQATAEIRTSQNESEEERNITLEDQRHHNLRRQ